MVILPYAYDGGQAVKNNRGSAPDRTMPVKGTGPLLPPVPTRSPVRQLTLFADPVAEFDDQPRLSTLGSVVQQPQDSLPVSPTAASQPAPPYCRQPSGVEPDSGDHAPPCSVAADGMHGIAPVLAMGREGVPGDARPIAGANRTDPAISQPAQADLEPVGEPGESELGCGPSQQSTAELLDSIRQPIPPGLIPLARSPHTPPSRPRRTKARNTTATRRSHRVKNRKQEVTGGGNVTMKLARKLIVSKRGLAIAEKDWSPHRPSQGGAPEEQIRGGPATSRLADLPCQVRWLQPRSVDLVFLMNCNFLIWNVRGLNDVARRGVMCALIRRHNVSVVCIQETKLQFIDLEIVRQCCGSLFSEFCYAPADGTRGGILVAWKPEEFQMISHFASPWSVAVHGCVLKSETQLNLITVYGPQADADKLLFLNSIKDVLANDLPQAVPTIITGDFNLIVQASDKSNQNINRRHMAAFRGLINNLQLKDLYLQGRRYTWSNEQQAATMVKLDRVLFNQEWDEAFPNCLLQAISSEMSDHCPILLSSDAGFRPVRRFRFENAWVGRDDFLPTVQSAWESVQQQVDPFINLHAKLSAAARALTSWSSQFTNDLELRAAISSELIFRLDQAMDCRQLTEEERHFRAMLKVNCLGIAALQRTMWRQRSRIQWLREGDASTRFFHAKASARRRKSFIHRIEFEDKVHTDQQGKEEALWGFFQDLLGEPRRRQHTLNLAAMGIAPIDLSDQEVPITTEEVQAAIMDMPSDKAPGADGFTALFFKKCWPIICFDIMRAIATLECKISRNLHLLNSANMIEWVP
ncbi:hypothetical protein ACQ4PT_027467 [Festuca glaucescens]